jgi:CheY-like chemotaxis protein
MGGLAMLGRLRADGALDGVPVIAFTSCASDADRARYLAAGAVGTIAKPFDPGTLHLEIARLIDGA